MNFDLKEIALECLKHRGEYNLDSYFRYTLLKKKYVEEVRRYIQDRYKTNLVDGRFGN